MPVAELMNKTVTLSLYLPKVAAENASASVEVTPVATEFTVIGVIDQLDGSSQAFIRYSDIPDITFDQYQFRVFPRIADFQ